MPAMTLRNLSEELHRAIKERARENGVSTEAEVRDSLGKLYLPEERLKFGTALFELSRRFGGVDLEITRDRTPTDAPDFE
ncbi:MAG: plasmid stability protein [Acidobacteriota bacterium]